MAKSYYEVKGAYILNRLFGRSPSRSRTPEAAMRRDRDKTAPLRRIVRAAIQVANLILDDLDESTHVSIDRLKSKGKPIAYRYINVIHGEETYHIPLGVSDDDVFVGWRRTNPQSSDGPGTLLALILEEIELAVNSDNDRDSS